MPLRPDTASDMTQGNNTESSPDTQQPRKQRGGFFGNLIFNIIIPVVVLSRFSGEDSLGPMWSIVVALSFPIAYGLWDLRDTGKINPFSVIGVVSVFLTGGISLLQLDPQYIAIKEAAIPGAIGLAVLISQKTRFPLVKTLILNGQLIRVEALYQALAAKGNTALFERRLSQASLIVAASFFLSSALNYILARVILVSPPGTTEFSEQLGRMTALSYPVIAIPSMIVLLIAIWFVFSQIHRLTDEKLETFLIDNA
ncbi:Dihydroorotate dehydrogenase 2 [Pseudohongiella spirulinae]|uniref:Dihydroorotate dehydrogenase 2 n=2 Tax=Pseudohongiella spirulinae TaxID=1249552 RepID=A0A0S2KB91_9GAMM|nr:Dihydroorotate dehydrogenase 2 [Pseudohongiella spirulinae]